MNEITLKMRKALAFILIWVLMFNSMPMMQLNVKAQESVDATVTGGDSVTDNGSSIFSLKQSVESSVETKYYEGTYPKDGKYPIPEYDTNAYHYYLDETKTDAKYWGDSIYFGDCQLPYTVTLERLSSGVLQDYLQITVKPNESANFRFSQDGPISVEMENEEWVYEGLSALLTNETDCGVNFVIASNGCEAQMQNGTDNLQGKGAGRITITAELVDDKNHYNITETDELELMITIKGQKSYFFEQEEYTVEYPQDGIYSIPQLVDNHGESIIYKFTDGTVINNGTIDLSNCDIPEEKVLQAIKVGDNTEEEIVATTTIKITPNTSYTFCFEVEGDTITYEEDCTYTLPTLKNECPEGEVVYSLAQEYEGVTFDVENRLLSVDRAIDEVKVIATKLVDSNKHYKEKTAEFVLIIERIPQEEGALRFVKGGEAISTDTIKLQAEDENRYYFEASSTQSEGAITYSINVSEDEAEIVTEEESGKKYLLLKKSGTVEITARQENDEKYLGTEVTLMLTVNRATQTEGAFRFVKDGKAISADYIEKQFEVDKEYVFKAESTLSDGTIKYTIKSQSIEGMVELVVNQENEEQRLVIKKPGIAIIRAEQGEDDKYKGTYAELCLVIKSEQASLAFVNSPSTITYNQYTDNMIRLVAEGGTVEDGIRYELLSQEVDGQKCEDVVRLSEEDGKLKILKAGDIVVKAINYGNNSYLPIESEEHRISILKANQSISFEVATPNPFIYGSETSYTNKAVEIINEEFKGSSDIDIQYRIVEGMDIATVDEMGTLYFADNKIGTVKVEAYKPGDGRYNETSATYVLEVQYEEVPEVTYSLKKDDKGTSTLDEEKWFNHDVYIWAPEGYQISRSNKLHGNQWQDALVLTTVEDQESQNEEAFYLKKVEGGITNKLLTNPIKIDRKEPQVDKIYYSTPDKDRVDGSTIVYYNVPVNVMLSASDTSSGIENFTYFTGESKEGDGTTVTPSEFMKEWSYSFVISPQFRGQAYLEVSDKAGNRAYSTNVEGGIVVDDIAPVLKPEKCTNYKKVVYSENLSEVDDYQNMDISNSKRKDINVYYTDEVDVVMSFIIEEENFNSDEVEFKDNDIKQAERLHWQQLTGEESNKWKVTYTIPKEEVGKHVITLEYQDRALNEKIDYTSETIIIDAAAPEISLTYIDGLPASSEVAGIAYYGANKKAEICIKEDNFRASDVEIAITTKDAVEAIDVDAYNTYLKNAASWTETIEGYKAYIDFVTDARYDISITYKDLALQDAQKCESKIVVDNKFPEKQSLATAEAYNTNSEAFKRMVDEANRKVLVADDKTRFIYQDAMTFKFAMKEINFDANQVQLSVYRDDNLLKNGDGYSYEPKNNWKTDATSYIHTLTLELGKKNGELVDGKYKVEINYKDLAGHDMITYISNTITIDQTPPDIQFTYDNKDANNDLYYNKNRVATITVTDRNVVSEEIIVNVTATDIDGNVVPFDLATKQSAWTFDKETNTWTSKVTYDVDAKYDFTIFCNDMATNEYSRDDSFTVDKLAPSKDSFRFEYSTALPDKGDSNNAFYKDKVTVKIIAEDVTSPIDYFEWTYIKQPGASSINQDAETHIIRNTDSTFEYDETKRTATAEFTLTADQARQYRGNLRFKATDMAGNTSEELTDAEKIVVVDTISPTRMVEYSPASQIVNKDTLHTVTGFDYATENVGAVLLYNAPMTVTFKVNEANFYADDIVVKVNDVEKSVTNWTKAGDVWTGSLPISENGEYIVTLQYTDRSTNEMVDYVSHEIVIDTIKPQIHITYGPNDIKQQVDGIKYYDKQQTATITITEHNFRADDIEVLVKATDVNGNNINVTDYDSYLRSRSSWTKQGDTYTAQITYATDANYEFDIMYKDLALIPADDYPNDVFTVDQTAPINVSVSYSSPIYEKTIQGTAYEYYNEPIVVTITAEDDVSGIYSFDYRYFRADGASSVNAENVANKIEAQKITYSNGKKTATATFVIPASELRNGTQINGSMEYVAYNRALTTTEYKDPRRYVVDNIVPNVTVEYNDYVDYENNISYYADDIDVTITVDEANFFADDVKVSVSKDGGEQTTANVSWRTVSVDKHIGSFTMEEEGNYKVYVSYQDPATNKMGEYQSNQLTIDKTKPVVSVSGIRYNSANKKDKIGFVVTAEDINLNTKSFRPKLMAEIRDESGKLNQVDCTELGTIETVVNGKSCTYTIENIDQDGIYRFSCEVSDMSGNVTEDMMVTDSGNKEVSKLDYSVNRNGSTYGLDESTKKLNNSFIREAKDVIVYETNPDEISNIKITLFKNDKAIVLVEGKDYVVNKISEDGEWYKYEYIIYAANFMEDGTYRISIYSEDKAGNVAENNLDVKNVEINFGVDKTVPNLIVTNLEKNRTYPLDKLSVLMQATDNMKLVNITVELDGKVVATWDEEQIQQMSTNLQDFVFDILGDTTQAHTVTITLTDIAGNECVETISDFYVTRNMWIRFTNNKVLFYGSIMACLAVGFSFIPLWKRRKKRKEARG